MLRSGRRVRSAAVPAAAAAILWPRLTSACEVCYGQAESPWIDASQAAVFLLLGVTLAVQGAFVVFFLKLRKRSRDAARARAAMRLVEGRGV